MENTAFPGPGEERLAGSISDQIAQIERELAREAGGAVIDLANTSAPAVPPEVRPRLVNARRSKLPVLIGWPGPAGRTIEVWCPYCQVFHTHGRCGGRCDRATCPCPLHASPHGPRGPRGQCYCPVSAGDGHRAAHCYDRSNSPFRETGYVIREVRP